MWFCSNSDIREDHNPSFTRLTLFSDINYENYIVKCQTLKYLNIQFK